MPNIFIKMNWHASIISWLLYFQGAFRTQQKEEEEENVQQNERQWSRLANFQFLILIFWCGCVNSSSFIHQQQKRKKAWNCRLSTFFLPRKQFQWHKTKASFNLVLCIMCVWVCVGEWIFLRMNAYLCETVQRTMSMQTFISISLQLWLRFKKQRV